MTKAYEADLFTIKQLNQLGYTGGKRAKRHEKPLLVCDVDEVVVHLVDPFVTIMEERGYELRSHAFQLTGNVFERETGREATQEEVWEGLTQLFKEQERRQGIVDGVVDGLNGLSDSADVIFLTNMPHPFGDIRRAYLASRGLEVPLVTNSRSKVPAIRILASHCTAGIGFVDDTPKNLQQVADALPDVKLFHFMANDTFRDLAQKVDGIHFSTGDWAEARQGMEMAFNA